MTLAEIADVVGGVAHGEATVTGGAFLDTRTPEAGGLFVAIAGERVDGHDFAAAAGAAGAVAALGTRPTDLPTVVVDDVTAALGRLARHVVDRLPDVVVLAMTGSQGKTGTKDYLAHVLAEAGPTVATRGNFNNELGVPLTVLRATPETRYLVVEMGARGVGHIAELCEIAPPHVAAVLNVGTAHIGEFGSREAIAQAKGEIVEALRADGTAVLNADDDLVAAMASRTGATVTTFGSRAAPTSPSARSPPTSSAASPSSWSTAAPAPPCTSPRSAPSSGATPPRPPRWPWPPGSTSTRSPTRWATPCRRAAGGWSCTERADGLVVLNDAYNANPESMRAALDTLGGIGAAQRSTYGRGARRDARARRRGRRRAHRRRGRTPPRPGSTSSSPSDRPPPPIAHGLRGGRQRRPVWPSPRRGVTRPSTGCDTMSRLLMSSW